MSMETDTTRHPRRLRRCERLRTRGEFQRVLESGGSFSARGVRFRYAPNELGWSRLGLTVGRRAGGAVQRNRVRRLLREGFRLAKGSFPRAVDIVAAPPADGETSLERVRSAFALLAAAILRGRERKP